MPKATAVVQWIMANVQSNASIANPPFSSKQAEAY